MAFNPDVTKPQIEVIFSTKVKKPILPELIFNGVTLIRGSEQKHLGLVLDSSLSFNKTYKKYENNYIYTICDHR